MWSFHVAMIDCVFICFVLLGSVTAIPSTKSSTRLENQPSLEPREDGTADAAGFLNALAAHRFKYITHPESNEGRVINTAKFRPILGKTGASVARRQATRSPARSSPQRQSENQLRQRGNPVNLARSIDLKQELGPGLPDVYVGEVRIPAKPRPNQRDQTFMTMFDTARSDFRVPGISCIESFGCDGPDDSKYDESGDLILNSVGEHSDNAMYYYQGDVYLDTVELEGCKIPKYPVTSVNSQGGAPTFHGTSIATMGVGPVRIATASIPPGSSQGSFLRQLLDSKEGLTAGAEPKMCFYHGRRGTLTFRLSRFTVGGEDSVLYTGAPKTLPVSHAPDDQTKWRVAVNEIKTNGAPIPNPASLTAIMDTGTSLIVLPAPDAEKLYAQIPGSVRVRMDHAGGETPVAAQAQELEHSYNVYLLPCNAPPNVEFGLGDQGLFGINAADINIGRVLANDIHFQEWGDSTALADARRQDVDLCLSPVVGLRDLTAPALDEPGRGTRPEVVLGSSFLKNWYSCYVLDGEQGSQVMLAKGVEPDTWKGGDVEPSLAGSSDGEEDPDVLREVVVERS